MDESAGSLANVDLPGDEGFSERARVEPVPLPGPGLLNIVTSIVFAGVAVMWVVFFVHRYTVYNSGHGADVAVGLWGLYYYALLAWGAARIRPREKWSGAHHALLAVALAQGSLFLLTWGSAEIQKPIKSLSMAGVVAAAAGILLAVPLILTSRRGWLLAFAEFGGPAAFLFMCYVYPKK